MILNIDPQDRSETTRLHVITHRTVHVTIPVVIETMDLHLVNATTLRTTPHHETIRQVIVTTRHLVAGITHPVAVTTSFHELIMTWTWVLVAMVQGSQFF